MWAHLVIWPGCHIRILRPYLSCIHFVATLDCPAELAWASLCQQACCPSSVQFCLTSPVFWWLSCLPAQHILLLSSFPLWQRHPKSWILVRSQKFKIWKSQYFWIKYLKIREYNPNFLSTQIIEGVLKHLKKTKPLSSQLCLSCSERTFSDALGQGPSGIDLLGLETEFSAQC